LLCKQIILEVVQSHTGLHLERHASVVLVMPHQVVLQQVALLVVADTRAVDIVRLVQHLRVVAVTTLWEVISIHLVLLTK
jgi:hypothetical protein